jgi:hypothetical protein
MINFHKPTAAGFTAGILFMVLAMSVPASAVYDLVAVE